jgi:hypothetical protein
MASRLWVAAICLVAACATVRSGEPANELAYSCDDLVVIGRIAVLSEESLPDAAPFPGWQSRWELEVRIKRVVRGVETRPAVRATSVSHGQLREDLDFLTVLSPRDDGSFVLAEAAAFNPPAGPRPRLAERCT